MEPGFFGPGFDAPVFQIARATERYSGSDLKELCKSAAYGPIRDLLASESRERVERQRMRHLQNGGGGGGGGDAGGFDSLDSSFDNHLDDSDDDFFSPQKGTSAAPKQRLVKRCMTFADFAAVLSKTSTSAEAASTYRHAEAERHFERDQRGRATFSGGGGGGGDSGGAGAAGGSEWGGGPGSASQAAAADMQQAMSAVTAEQLQQLMAAFMSRGGVGAGRGGMGEHGSTHNSSNTNNGAVLEVTPEMLTQMMQQFMIHQQQNGGGV